MVSNCTLEIKKIHKKRLDSAKKWLLAKVLPIVSRFLRCTASWGSMRPDPGLTLEDNEGGTKMGDRSPKDKMKQKKQHDVDAQKHHQQKQDNMMKNRKDQGAPGNKNDPVKKAG